MPQSANVALAASTDSPLWPLAVYFALVVFMVGVILVITHLLGQRHRQQATGEPYESGIAPTGAARGRFSVDYYLVAVLFVVFDLETAFLVTWAIALRQSGWTGYLAAAAFVAVLLLSLLYLWRQGALDWMARRRPPVTRPPALTHRGEP